MDTPEFFSVLLAGGSGTRFWPASRRSTPKQLLQLHAGKSLLYDTWSRQGDLVDEEPPLLLLLEYEDIESEPICADRLGDGGCNALQLPSHSLQRWHDAAALRYEQLLERRRERESHRVTLLQSDDPAAVLVEHGERELGQRLPVERAVVPQAHE